MLLIAFHHHPLQIDRLYMYPISFMQLLIYPVGGILSGLLFYSLAVVDSLNRDFKQTTTAGADTAAGSKYPPKWSWDAAHVPHVHCIKH